MGMQVPVPLRVPAAGGAVQRVDVLGGQVHEYLRAA
jgi:hypothetical protein